MKYLDALIIGAGFSGLYQLHCLRDKLKLNTLVLEEGDDLGGRWYWNRYPGARCDSESFTYGFTFSKKIFKKPYLLNVKTHRIYWHAGAGKDSDSTFDRYNYEKKKLGKIAIQFDQRIKKEMEDLWIKQLKKQ